MEISQNFVAFSKYMNFNMCLFSTFHENCEIAEVQYNFTRFFSDFEFIYDSFLIFSLQFFSIIVFGCISSSGWFFMQNLGQEVCVLNMDSSACHFSTMVGIVAFLASIGFLVGEWYDSHFFYSLTHFSKIS